MNYQQTPLAMLLAEYMNQTQGNKQGDYEIGKSSVISFAIKPAQADLKLGYQSSYSGSFGSCSNAYFTPTIYPLSKLKLSKFYITGKDWRTLNAIWWDFYLEIDFSNFAYLLFAQIDISFTEVYSDKWYHQSIFKTTDIFAGQQNIHINSQSVSAESDEFFKKLGSHLDTARFTGKEARVTVTVYPFVAPKEQTYRDLSLNLLETSGEIIGFSRTGSKGSSAKPDGFSTAGNFFWIGIDPSQQRMSVYLNSYGKAEEPKQPLGSQMILVESANKRSLKNAIYLAPSDGSTWLSKSYTQMNASEKAGYDTFYKYAMASTYDARYTIDIPFA